MTRGLSIVFALACLATCIASPVLFFRGDFSQDLFRELFTIASIGWFVTATVWVSMRKKG